MSARPNHTDAAPADLLQKIAHGNNLIRKGNIAEAVELGRTLASDYPDQGGAFAFAAEACNVQGEYGEALEWIDKAIERSDNPQYKIKKAWLLSRLLRRDEIFALVEQLAEQVRNNALLLWQLGKLCFHHNHRPRAVELFERALMVGGERPDWRYDLSVARFYSGDFERAEQDMNVLLAVAPQNGAVVYLRSTLRKQQPERNNVVDIQERLKAGFQRAEDEAAALYALAKELEDLGEHERSFSALAEGAKKKRSAIKYDMSEFRQMLHEIRDVQDAAALSIPSAGCEEEGAIFIVGMPRTGTTLAERILLQSGKVKDAGELMDFGALLSAAVRRVQAANPPLSPAQATMQVDFAEIGRKYMQGARQMAAGNSRFIDKMPANYMYCGVMHKALPKAKIIHLVRDPLDSCYAIFKTLFFNAYDFSYDLDELAEYYILYRQMMRHWHEVMPGVILDVRYEDLVADTEMQARRIYDWCGLEWTPAALAVPDKKMVFATASAVQVREPVHTRSVNSSRKHADKLAPLAEKLAAAGMLQF